MIQSRLSFLRNKFFLFTGTLLLIILYIVSYSANSNEQTAKQTLLLKIKKLELQNEAYNKQFEGILKSERELYERTKKDLNAVIREKQLRFSSLQQEYKILKTQNDDHHQQCESTKKDIARTNEELRGRLDKTQSVYENLKVKHENLLSDKEKLEKLIENKQEASDCLLLKYKNYQLEQDNKELKKLHHENQEPENTVSKTLVKAIDFRTQARTFHEQIRDPVSADHYKIPIAINNKEIVLNSQSTTTTTTTTKAIVQRNISHVASTKMKQLPRGVLPIPDLKVSDLNFVARSQPDAEPKQSLDDTLGKPQSELDGQNNAAEELMEFNDEILQDDGDKMINNAAEELEQDVHKLGEKKVLREMDLENINRAGNGVKDRLNDEIAGDHGKEAGYPEDLHMIEGQQEENDDLGDVGDYDDPRRKIGIAERN